MEKLRDIRTLEHIDDISLYLFIALVVFIALIIGTLLYKLFSTLQARRRENIREKVLQKLKDIEFNNPKKAAYKITKYANFLADDERSQKILKQLLPKLEKYKYKKNVPDFDQETIGYYNLFIKSVDEQ